MFLVGESGIGKSRLAAAAADLGFAADMRLLRGRGSAIGPMVPYRSLTEALLSLLRTGDPIDVAALGPYRPILARLIPDWGDPPAEAESASLVILAEAVLRLTGLAGHERGCLMILDDLQDADAETLAVVEYLIDNLDRQPTMLLGTIRADQCPALDLARSAGQRGTGVLIELDRLDRADMRRLVGSNLGVRAEEVPEPAVDLLWAGSAGNPFRIEELLGGVIDGGLLVQGGDGWQVTDELHTTLPATFVRSMATRVDLLGPRTRDVLSVAAVLGRRFPPAVVQAVTGLDYRDLLSHLHGDLATQLVAPDGHTPDWYVFRHQLIVEALLTLLSPGERARLAHEVADGVERVYPGLPGEWCQLCAALRVDAGDPVRAGLLFAESGARALAQGAAQSAVTLLDKAWDLLAHDPAARAAALETQLYALAEAGLIDRALAVVGILDQVGAGLSAQRRARLHTRIAWVAVHAGRVADGLNQVAAARALIGPDAAAEDTAPIDVVAAHLEMDVPGPGQMRKAEEMARRAAVVAEAVPLPAVACQALQLLGALTRPRDPEEATALLERSRSLAVQHNLPIWETHALVRLGHDGALRDGSIDRLEQAREQASRFGAVTARYQAEVNIALQLILRGDFDAAGTLIEQVVAATTRLKLLETTQYMLLYRAVLAGHRGRRRDLDTALAEFHHRGGDQAQHASRVHGLARAFCALLEENPDLARTELASSLAAEESNPNMFQLTGRYGLDLLLGALSGEVDWTRYDRVVAAPASRLRWDRQFAVFARAVLEGQAGHAEATATVAEALAIGEPYAMARHLGLRLVGEAALAGGWGEPVEWLRAAEEYFHTAEVPAVAGACRSLMRRSGAKIAQRRGGIDEIPVALRSSGVTVREYEVLRLLVKRLGNREIADQLHLSQRTVEKHVSSLITKTGLPNRIALSKFAEGAFAADTPGAASR
ncbi:regulatory protein, luxR family [Actinokineospora alba]|uniref:Regulatory protein, luxR family n=2 Tax=Actinokineospora alba TaxID=504798 RepID=A0A1H0R8B7_9PSEU|nr:regulatory LuxR family protein [Actinokineospora alba]SDI36572.1 regulatory protein, luxR family [Actinokineospora alba]SDP25306.1 regulatory protein, luxR family [Actinokineospora alba]